MWAALCTLKKPGLWKKPNIGYSYYNELKNEEIKKTLKKLEYA